MLVLDRRAVVAAPNARVLGAVREIVIHKTSLSQAEPHNPSPILDVNLDAAGMAEAFCRGPMQNYTGGAFPYHFLVRRPNGAAVEQCLALAVAGAHAVNHNGCSWAVAYVGEEATSQQYRALVRVCAGLVLLRGGAAAIWGHAGGGHPELTFRLPDASPGDPHKICPGPGFDIESLRHDVVERLGLDGQWRAWSGAHVRAVLEGEGFNLEGYHDVRT